MTESDETPTEEELEESYSDEPDDTYTVQLNGKEYALNEEARRAIQIRAEYEYEENEMFTCFWKVASPEQYEDGKWEETIHDAGDPVLVIETQGPMAPWDRLDQLNVEMQEVGPDSPFANKDDSQEQDNGNGVKTMDPDAVDNDSPEREIPRTHFEMTPQNYEEVPGPDGEEKDKVPAKPEKMGDDPALVAWVPDDPNIEHTWAAGEAITPIFSRVEWNVQKKLEQPRPYKDKDSSEELWESMLKSWECEKLRELAPSQDPTQQKQRDPSDDDVPDHFEEGKYGGDNWQV